MGSETDVECLPAVLIERAPMDLGNEERIGPEAKPFDFHIKKES